MNANMKWLQELQDAYASICNLTLLTVDANGHLVTNPSGVNSFTKLIIEDQSPPLRDRIRTVLDNLHQIAKPILYDHERPGIKSIFAPVRAGEETVYTIVAGVIIEEGARELILEYFDTHSTDSEVWKEALYCLPETPAEAKQELIQRIGTMSDLVSKYADFERFKEMQKQELNVLHEITGIAGSLHDLIPSLLERFIELGDNLEFVGYAKKAEDDSFLVSHVTGESCDQLVNASFLIGEGFLGQVALTGQFRYWDNISRDPRTLFFTQNEMVPSQLFCYPVKREDEVIALLFGGSASSVPVNPDILEFGQLVARLMGMHLTHSLIREEMNIQLMRLNSMLEVCQMMTVAQDLKRILLLLVDMSMNLVMGPFACVVLKQQDRSSKVQIISRGLTPEQIEMYGKDASQRHLTQSHDESSPRETVISQTSWGPIAIESLLIYQGEVQGVLCVAVNDAKEAAEHQALLSSLAVMGGISIQQVIKKNGLKETEQTIHVLHRVMEQWSREEYHLTLHVKEMAVAFGKKLGLSDRETDHLAGASLLLRYDPDLLKDILASHTVVKILREYSSAVQTANENPIDNHSYGTSAQILLLVNSYLEHDRNLDVLDQITGVDKGVREEFKAFLSSEQIVEREVSVSGAPLAEEQEANDPELRPISERMLLTSREQDVLKLVIKGLSNREIAETLFISEHTVKNHMSNIFQKLGVSDRTQLIAKVYRNKTSFL